MLNFHNPSVVFLLLLGFVFLYHRVQMCVLLAYVVSVGHPHVKECILTSPPENRAHMSRRALSSVLADAVYVLFFLYWLEIWFTFNVRTDPL